MCFFPRAFLLGVKGNSEACSWHLVVEVELLLVVPIKRIEQVPVTALCLAKPQACINTSTSITEHRRQGQWLRKIVVALETWWKTLKIILKKAIGTV
ncbi:hypothetical protein FR483_n265R [Paramecium bursaria Chlorella virus FR483]|uniref:Uncharacterized protein n265R n=1 Tax=Paramecium bursaria Chlorella virus FR483 TaxID=399781 RepID=A7J6W9_PBCVF|nr:hypothetical protein FR483_n265R [Paramecium bursaria Chlorella virus FR483]ABT15550.1 hypothetical protein FR483_n265R [Paramecium bursaria Chlorella virus FR483]